MYTRLHAIISKKIVVLIVSAAVTSNLTSGLMSCGMLHHAIWYGFTDIREEHTASIIRDMEVVDMPENLVLCARLMSIFRDMEAEDMFEKLVPAY